ncbi:MAG: OmpH family outer membrane protein [Blastocatellia bacterium]
MFKIRFAALAAVILATMASVASAQQATQAGVSSAIPDGKIAVINTQAFPDGISELKQKYEQVNNQFKDRSQRLQTAQTRLTEIENRLKTQGNVLKPDEVSKLQDEYTGLKKNAERDLEDAKAEYERAVDSNTRPVRDKLYQFLQNYATQRGIVMIINLAGAAQSGTLAYWNPGADITDDFIAEYNKANPVAGAPATPRPQPAPTSPVRKP